MFRFVETLFPFEGLPELIYTFMDPEFQYEYGSKEHRKNIENKAVRKCIVQEPYHLNVPYYDLDSPRNLIFRSDTCFDNEEISLHGLPSSIQLTKYQNMNDVFKYSSICIYRRWGKRYYIKGIYRLEVYKQFFLYPEQKVTIPKTKIGLYFKGKDNPVKYDLSESKDVEALKPYMDIIRDSQRYVNSLIKKYNEQNPEKRFVLYDKK